MALIKASQIDIPDLISRLQDIITNLIISDVNEHLNEHLGGIDEKINQLLVELDNALNKANNVYDTTTMDGLLALKSENIHSHQLTDLIDGLDWINKFSEKQEQPPSFFIDIQTEKGKSNKTLPVGWKSKYVGIGEFTLTHNMAITEVGFMLNVIHDGHAKVITPTKITENSITFKVTNNDQVCNGNVIGQLIF